MPAGQRQDQITRGPGSPRRRAPHSDGRRRLTGARWAALCSDLVNEFPDLDRADIVAQVARARAATALFGLDHGDQLQTSAAIARNNLRLINGEADLARLDPENHVRRKRTP